MENKSIEEIANSQKNFLSTGEVAAVLGISPVTFRRRAEEYAKFLEKNLFTFLKGNQC